MTRRHTWLAVVVTASLAVAACGSDDNASSGTTDASGSGGTPGTTLTLVTYDSFPDADTGLHEALAEFTASTGIGVRQLVAGDAGTMLAKAALTAGNPEGDVMWGVDNTLLSRALDNDVFDGEPTAVDFGDVCVNADLEWFAERDLALPATLDELAAPAYRDLLVVSNPATSSPGLAFLLATIDEYGADGWQDYWQALVDNGVTVVDGWSQAYYEEFTRAGGPSPLVVSYGSSPPAEVIFADPPRDDAPTTVIEDTCFRQVEYAGVLRGTEHPDAARTLVEFLVSERFQRELPLTLFVYPVNEDVELPAEFVEFAIVPDDPRTLDPDVIEADRERWIDEWTSLVLG